MTEFLLSVVEAALSVGRAASDRRRKAARRQSATEPPLHRTEPLPKIPSFSRIPSFRFLRRTVRLFVKVGMRAGALFCGEAKTRNC